MIKLDLTPEILNILSRYDSDQWDQWEIYIRQEIKKNLPENRYNYTEEWVINQAKILRYKIREILRKTCYRKMRQSIKIREVLKNRKN